MKREDVDTYEKLGGQLLGLHDELSLLSKKSPQDAVNTFKLKFINVLLEQANNFLGDSYRPFNDFKKFDLDDVPQNSDVVFILSQYTQCFEKLKADNVVFRNGRWYWQVPSQSGKTSDETIRTLPPKRLRE